MRTPSNWFDTELLGVPTVEARTVRDLLPRGRVGDLLSRVPGDRYLRPAEALAGADIVHSQDLGFWYSMQAARLKRRGSATSSCSRCGRRSRSSTPGATSARARTAASCCARPTASSRRPSARRLCLELEGAPPERIESAPPGVDTELFVGRARWRAAARARDPDRRAARLGEGPPGRAARRRGAAPRRDRGSGRAASACSSSGAGPEEARLRRYAPELGVGDRVEFRAEVPYEQMPAVHAGASCLVLASLPAVVLGGAVRHGAGRGDGGRAAGDRRAPRERSARSAATRSRTSPPATGSRSRARWRTARWHSRRAHGPSTTRR